METGVSLPTIRKIIQESGLDKTDPIPIPPTSGDVDSRIGEIEERLGKLFDKYVDLEVAMAVRWDPFQRSAAHARR